MQVSPAPAASVPEAVIEATSGRKRRPPTEKQQAWRREFGEKYGAVSTAWKQAHMRGEG